ncbi:MAG TPA: hypothetical protein VEQ84_11815 [Vicinamibacteria bacterium]|nr:hypothetical protein [Vicinamibacteria bacterium]
MRVAVFSSKPYDVTFLTAANRVRGHDLLFLEPRLAKETAALASGLPAICAFVNIWAWTSTKRRPPSSSKIAPGASSRTTSSRACSRFPT